MNIANNTNVDYWFGPMRLPANGSITLDDITDTSLYLVDDGVADAINALVLSTKITVTNTNPNSPFPRPTGTPQVVHGDGAPEGVIYASQGSIYMRRDNSGATDSVYAKTTGVDLSTGWSAVGASGFYAVGATFPASPAAGAAFALKTGHSFISFVFDGTSWYSQPIPALVNASGTGTDSTPDELAGGGLFDIGDAISAGCTVQMRIDAMMLVGSYDGSTAYAAPGFATASSGGGLSGVTEVSGAEISITNGSLPYRAEIGTWQDAATSGDVLQPWLLGWISDSTYGETSEISNATIWLRFKK